MGSRDGGGGGGEREGEIGEWEGGRAGLRDVWRGHYRILRVVKPPVDIDRESEVGI